MISRTGRPKIEVINHVPLIRQCPPVRGQWKKLASLSVKSVLDYVNSFILQILHEHLNKLNPPDDPAACCYFIFVIRL